MRGFLADSGGGVTDSGDGVTGMRGFLADL